LLTIFEVLVVVVLLNLLIALMGDIFGKVQANAQAESTYGIAKLVVEYEGLMSESEKTKHEEQWLEDDTIDDVLRLEKKVDDLKKEFSEKVDELNKNVADLKNENAELKADIKDILSILKNNT
jgi:predicted  nucleic acid-binding Zn-ribbon protein